MCAPGGCLVHNFASEGLGVAVMLAPPLRPSFDVACVTYDWVHTVLQHGVLNIEVERMMVLGAPLGITREAVQTFLRDEAWQFPHAGGKKQRALHRIFDLHRVSDKEPNKVRCTSSELLGVYGLLRPAANSMLCPLSSNRAT